MKPNPKCKNCGLINIIFKTDELPIKCWYCGNNLEAKDET